VTAGRYFDELDLQDEETVRYACADSDFTLRLYHLFNNWFDRYLPKHRFIVEKLESPAAVYCGLMKYNGLLADKELMLKKQAEAKERIKQLKEEIAFMIGDVNIGANASTSAFKKYLYGDLKLPVFKTTAKYQEAMDDEAMILLSEWCRENRPELAALFELVQEYRRWGKIKSTYIDGYLEHINSVTGRIHPDLFPLGAETGRFAAKNPNLQNCPRKDNDPVGVRNFFIAPKGKALLSLDFSQIELRVGAFYCRDGRMLETCRTRLVNPRPDHHGHIPYPFRGGCGQKRGALQGTPRYRQKLQLRGFLRPVPKGASAEPEIQGWTGHASAGMRADYSKS
jgi:DNA polymerase-1